MRKFGGHRETRSRRCRLASALVVLCSVAGSLTAVTVTNGALGSAPAFADTGTVNYDCNGITIPTDITGSIPATLVAGETFTLSNYQVQVTIPSVEVAALQSDGVTSLSGTTGALIEATNATPSSYTPSFTWGPVYLSPGNVTFDIPSSPTSEGSFTATSTVPAYPPELSAGTFTTTLVIDGGPVASTCTPPSSAPIIASASTMLAATPSATSIVAGTPGGLTDTATVSGAPGSGAPSGTIDFSVCAAGTSPCLSTSPPVDSLGSISLQAGQDDTSTATSDVYPTPSTPGTYCFDAVYDGAEDGSSGNCFVVTAPIACNPTCTGVVSSTAGTVAVSGSSTTSANMYLSVGESSLDCGNGYSAPAPVTTLQESNFTSSVPLAVTDTVIDPTLKHFAVCFQTLNGTFKDSHGAFVTTGLLHKCNRSYTTECWKSEVESQGSVIAQLLVNANDPKIHAGGTTPLVTGVTPTSSLPCTHLPCTAVTIKGLFLNQAQVKVGSVSARVLSASAKKIKMDVPAGVPIGTVPITITTPTGSTVYRTFKIT